MTNDECKRITLERLELWGRLCHERHDTPVVLVTVGHDQHSGRLSVEACKGGPSNRELGQMLLYGIQELCPELLTEMVTGVVNSMIRTGIIARKGGGR